MDVTDPRGQTVELRIFARDLADPYGHVVQFCDFHSFDDMDICTGDMLRNLAPVLDIFLRSVESNFAEAFLAMDGDHSYTISIEEFAGYATAARDKGNADPSEPAQSSVLWPAEAEAAAFTGADNPVLDLCDHPWVGSASAPLNTTNLKPIVLVISHCQHDLKWLDKHFQTIPIRETFVISKCGAPVTPLPSRFNMSIIDLPNVGKCDHTWAHWMAHASAMLSDDDVVVFLKDTYLEKPHQLNQEHTGLHEMIAGTIEYGFACGYRPTGGFSIFHNTAQLALFEVAHYTIHWQPSGRNDTGFIPAKLRPLGEWARYMNYTLPWPAAPVCYGGSFAVKASRIAPKRQLMKRFEEALSHGNNIEEGHYAERSWAALFHSIDGREGMLTPMLKWATSELNQNGGYMGMLLGCRKPVPCDSLQVTSIHTAFEKVDADGNCEISPAELMQALQLDPDQRPELLELGLGFRVPDADLKPFLLGGGRRRPRWIWRGAADWLWVDWRGAANKSTHTREAALLAEIADLKAKNALQANELATDGQVDGRIGGRMDGWTDGRTHAHMHARMHARTHARTHTRTRTPMRVCMHTCRHGSLPSLERDLPR